MYCINYKAAIKDKKRYESGLIHINETGNFYISFYSRKIYGKLLLLLLCYYYYMLLLFIMLLLYIICSLSINMHFRYQHQKRVQNILTYSKINE